MFETSQQEPSGGTGKIIGGVIVVAVVLLAVVYFVFLHGLPALTPFAQTPAATGAAASAEVGDADPMRDLTISKFNLGRDQTQTMSMWDIQVANRSRVFGYKDIQYATNYYDASGNVIYQGSGVLPGQLDPGDQRTITGINDGLYPLNTTRYTIELKGAQAFKP